MPTFLFDVLSELLLSAKVVLMLALCLLLLCCLLVPGNKPNKLARHLLRSPFRVPSWLTGAGRVLFIRCIKGNLAFPAGIRNSDMPDSFLSTTHI